MRLDAVDRKILTALQENGRMSLSEIARRAGVAPATAHERLKKLRRANIVQGFSVDLNYSALGYNLTAFVRLRTKFLEDVNKTINDLRAVPEVEEVHIVTGDYDLLLKVRARDPMDLQQVLTSMHGATGFIRSATEVCLSSPLERAGPTIDALFKD
jgi:Lrp/AsnC family transcriptional regulator for asnA, asnC and gidA